MLKKLIIVAIIAIVLFVTIIVFYRDSNNQVVDSPDPINAPREETHVEEKNSIPISEKKDSTLIIEWKDSLLTVRPKDSSPIEAEDLTPIGVETIPGAIMQMKSIISGISRHSIFFKEVIQGTNAEISQILLGNNPKQQILVGLSEVNEKGELVDLWGTHFDIHVSPLELASIQSRYPPMEFKIVSAGPNKIFGDDDDYMLEGKYP
ncbi:hypothetical protein [Candidatus Albibeggiatoa sp. nov. NOAA]|uniref:hypothetical protein n=1 Tax=Candidatus Albibeggiatoa sp. nov. NOAA TaxID=3162724 RepID=UPI0032F3C346|nr:hypothetical protein [Thiotrichaceae bacterium]